MTPENSFFSSACGFINRVPRELPFIVRGTAEASKGAGRSRGIRRNGEEITWDWRLSACYRGGL